MFCYELSALMSIGSRGWYQYDRHNIFSSGENRFSFESLFGTFSALVVELLNEVSMDATTSDHRAKASPGVWRGPRKARGRALRIIVGRTIGGDGASASRCR
jgi:hypothetical protein